MLLLQGLLHIATVFVALVTLEVAPRARRALVEGGTAVHAVGHAFCVGLHQVGGAGAAVVDAALAQEALGGPRDVVNCVVEGRAVGVVGRPWACGRPGCGVGVCGTFGTGGGGGGWTCCRWVGLHRRGWQRTVARLDPPPTKHCNAKLTDLDDV